MKDNEEIHIIRKQTFKLKLKNGKDPLDLEKRIQEIFRNKVLDKLADLFSSMGPPDLVIRIDKLTIDVGVIKADSLVDFEAEFATRVQSQARQIIQKILVKKNLPGIKFRREISKEEETLELLAVFLKTGRLPWWANKDKKAIEKLLGTILKTKPAEALKVISIAIQKQVQLQRLVRQFSQRELKAILMLKLQDAEWDTLSPYLFNEKAPAGAHNNRRFVAPARMQNWERSLKFVLTSQEPYNLQKLLKQLEAQPELNRNREGSVSGITSQSASSLVDQDQEAPIDLIPKSAPTIREVLIHFLIHGSLPRQFGHLGSEQLETVFRELIKEGPAQLYDLLEDIIDHAFALERLQYQFNPQLVHEILASFSGESPKFWKSVFNVLSTGMPERFHGQLAPEYIERFALKYIVKSYRQSFDLDAFIQAIWDELAKKAPAEADSILAAWQTEKSLPSVKEAIQKVSDNKGARIKTRETPEAMIKIALAYLQENKYSRKEGTAALDFLLKEAPMRLVEALTESLLTPHILGRLAISLSTDQVLLLLDKSAPGLEGKAEEVQEILISFLSHQKKSPSSPKVKKWLTQLFLIGALQHGPQRSFEGWSLFILRSLTDLLDINQAQLISTFHDWKEDRSLNLPRTLRVWMAVEDVIAIETVQKKVDEQVQNKLPFELRVEESDESEEQVEVGIEPQHEKGELPSGKDDSQMESSDPNNSQVDNQPKEEEETPISAKDQLLTEEKIAAIEEKKERIKKKARGKDTVEKESSAKRSSEEDDFVNTGADSFQMGSDVYMQSFAESLKILLKRGSIAGTTQKPEKVFREFLQYDVKGAKEEIRSHIDNPMIRARILSWLDDTSWKTLEASIGSALQKEIPQLITDINFLLKTELSKKKEDKKSIIRSSDLPKLKKLFLEARLVFILEPATKKIEQLLDQIVTILSGNLGIERSVFLFELRKATEAQRLKVNSLLPIWLGRLAKRKRKHRLPEAGEQSRKKRKKEIQMEPLIEGVTVSNGGAVILAPFLPRYFQVLGLRENGKFVDDAAHERAIHLLQYLITGQTDNGEHELILNKVLCGFPIEQPISRGIELQENEKAISEQLLNGVIQNWATIKRSSVAALRETFLQRQGLLSEKDEMWMLKIEEGSFDMILDTLPWSISMVKLSWMEKILQVEWR